MSFVDKRGVLARLNNSSEVVIELGCGPRKRLRNSIGIDVIDTDVVDIVGDSAEVLRAIPEATVDLISSSHFLEHVRDLDPLLRECVRVLKPAGTFEATVPHFSHPYFYADPTHVRPFGLYTFSYLAKDDHFRRKVPGYIRNEALELKSAELVFKSTRPFYGRHAFKKFLGVIFNASRYMQEFYEENLCYMFPCYEIRFVLRKIA